MGAARGRSNAGSEVYVVFASGFTCAVLDVLQRASRRQHREEAEAPPQPHSFGPIGLSGSDLAVQVPHHRRHRHLHRGRRVATSALPPPAISHVSTAGVIADQLEGGISRATHTTSPAGAVVASSVQSPAVVETAQPLQHTEASNTHTDRQTGSQNEASESRDGNGTPGSAAGDIATAGNSRAVPAGSKLHQPAGSDTHHPDNDLHQPAGNISCQPTDTVSHPGSTTVGSTTAGSNAVEPIGNVNGSHQPTDSASNPPAVISHAAVGISHVPAGEGEGEAQGNFQPTTGLAGRIRGLSDSLTQYWTAR